MNNSFSNLNAADVIDVILFKYNYYDYKIWTGVKNQMNFIQVNEQSILVSPKDLKTYIEKTYPNEINKFKSIGSEFLHKDANSIFFLNTVLNTMGRLKWIKLTLDKSKNYSRVVGTEATGTQIMFSFRVLHVTYRLFEMYSEEEIKHVNRIFKELNILEDNKPYQRHKMGALLDKLDMYVERISHDRPAEEVEPILIFLDSVEEKLERDNPEVLLVTDY